MKFLDYVSRDLINLGLDHIKEYTLVFPMHRAGLFMKEAIRDEIIRSRYNTPVLLPKMLTLDELVTDLSGMHTEDELSAVCLLYQLCKKYAGEEKFKMPLDVFYGWGRQLLTDFSNIQMLCLSDADNRKLLTLSGDAEKLENTDFTPEERAKFYELIGRSLEEMQTDCYIREVYLELWGHLPEIFEEFEKLQADAHLGSRGALTRYVCQHFDSEPVQRKILGRKYIFIGFNYLLDGERRIMELLKGQSMFYWDDCSGFEANEQAFKHVRKNIEQFGQQLSGCPEWEAQLTWPEHKPVNVIASASLGAQAQYVNKWLTDLYPAPAQKEKPISEMGDEERKAFLERKLKEIEPKGTTAIVIADEHMLESVVYSLPGHLSAMVNITKGYPLRDTRIFADLMTLLGDQKLKALSPAEVLDKVDDFLSLQERDERRSDDASWRHQLKQESYYQVRLVISRMRLILDNKKLSPLIADVKVLRCLMLRHLESVSLPFHGSPVTPIQVIGVLETRLLDFDHLLVLNCEEGTLPSHSADQSFLPYYIRQYYGMQTRTEEAEIFAYNFFRLLRRAGDATLLFSQSLGKKSMSRFLMQVLTSPAEFRPNYAVLTESAGVEVPVMDLIEPDGPNSYLDRYRRLEASRADRRAQNPMEKGNESKPLTLSPSAINTYLNCRRKFYLQQILGIREAVVPDRMLQANDIGNIIHAAVESIYRTISGDSFPYVVLPDEIRSYICDEAKISAAIDAGYATANKNYFDHHRDVKPTADNQPYVRAKHPGEEYLIREFILRILRYDVQHPFTLRGMELERFAQLEVPDENGQPIKVLTGGDIDRLDEVREDGADKSSLRILDYKTGSFVPARLTAADMDEVFSGDKDYILQTLVYCLSCVPGMGVGKSDVELKEGQRIMPELLYPSQALKDDYDPHILIADAPVTDFVADQKDAFLAKLTSLVSEILHQQTFEPCAEDKCKPHCPFFDLCGRKKNDSY